MRRLLLLLFLLTTFAQADQLWKAQDKSLTIKLPDGFAKLDKAVPANPAGDPILILYDRAQNIEFLASARKPVKLAQDQFEQELGMWLKESGGQVVDSKPVKAGWRPGKLFVLRGHYAEAIESALVFLPLSSSSQVLLFNYPADQRQQVLPLVTRAVSTVQLK